MTIASLPPAPSTRPVVGRKGPSRRFAKFIWPSLCAAVVVVAAVLAIWLTQHQAPVFHEEVEAYHTARRLAERDGVAPVILQLLQNRQQAIEQEWWGPFPEWWVNPRALQPVIRAENRVAASAIDSGRRVALKAGRLLAHIEAPWVKVPASQITSSVSHAITSKALTLLAARWNHAAAVWLRTINVLQKVSGGMAHNQPADVVTAIHQLSADHSSPTIVAALQAASQYLKLPPAAELAQHAHIVAILRNAVPKPATVAPNIFSPALIQYLGTRQSTVSMALYNLKTHTTYTFNPTLRFDTASIVKVTIMATLLWQSERSGQPLTASEQQLMVPMIEDSSNSAATTLWYDAGGSRGIQAFLTVAGMTQTIPGRGGYWGLTQTSAVDQVALLRLLSFPNAILDPASQAYAANQMRHVVGWEDWGVSGGVPLTATVALKNGWLPIGALGWEINSIGHIEGLGQDYVLAVLTHNNPTEAYGIQTVDTVSSLIWQALHGSPIG